MGGKEKQHENEDTCARFEREIKTNEGRQGSIQNGGVVESGCLLKPGWADSVAVLARYFPS